VDPEILTFLLAEFFQLTLVATVQRAKVYADGLNEPDRAPLRNALRAKLYEIWPTYAGAMPVPDNQHLTNIEQLANSLSQDHPDLLREGRFRIGPAQKALNLFLKYLWCAGLLNFPPPHCPFDRKIIGHLGLPINWTTLDQMAQYQQLVAAARQNANGVELAQWELELYNHL
jgi:hypothetical protein